MNVYLTTLPVANYIYICNIYIDPRNEYMDSGIHRLKIDITSIGHYHGIACTLIFILNVHPFNN